MSFKLLYTNLAGPQGDFLVDPSSTFEAGMVGTLQGTTTGTPTGLPQVILAATGTTGLLGIIDDNKTTTFLATVKNEAVTTVGIGVALAHANIISGTFATGTSGGAAAFVSGNGFTNGLATVVTTGVVSYSYIIPGKAGDDTTLASGKCTLWLQPGEYSTDVYEVATTLGVVQPYAVAGALYVSANSKLSAQVLNGGTGTIVGYVTKSPSAGNPFLNFYKI
jgi:hypothetical protein